MVLENREVWEEISLLIWDCWGGWILRDIKGGGVGLVVLFIEDIIGGLEVEGFLICGLDGVGVEGLEVGGLGIGVWVVGGGVLVWILGVWGVVF